VPQQETYFEQAVGGRRVEVLKTYDQNYAREAFGGMDATAQAHLWSSLSVDENYEPTDIPTLGSLDSEDFLWEELLDAAREDGSVLSFFVVNENAGNTSKCLYVSPDWPSAEAYAKSRLARVQ
jgi:hypothetical protein